MHKLLLDLVTLASKQEGTYSPLLKLCSYQIVHKSHAKGQVQSNLKRKKGEDFINEHTLRLN